MKEPSQERPNVKSLNNAMLDLENSEDSKSQRVLNSIKKPPKKKKFMVDDFQIIKLLG